jgi:crossover junction endodeoxyribonuclease RusA
VRAQDLALWRADIAKVARSVILERAQYGVEVSLVFTLKKPKTVTRSEPFKRPDIDKLCRAVLDGLTGVAYEDDEQVTKLIAVKEYGETEGVTIRITDKEKLRLSLLDAEIIIDGLLHD